MACSWNDGTPSHAKIGNRGNKLDCRYCSHCLSVIYLNYVNNLSFINKTVRMILDEEFWPNSWSYAKYLTGLLKLLNTWIVNEWMVKMKSKFRHYPELVFAPWLAEYYSLSQWQSSIRNCYCCFTQSGLTTNDGAERFGFIPLGLKHL